MKDLNAGQTATQIKTGFVNKLNAKETKFICISPKYINILKIGYIKMKVLTQIWV